MGVCMWCDNDVGGDRRAHSGCAAEAELRLGNCMCERCGVKPIDTEGDGNACAGCGRLGLEAPLVGYPPGGV